MNGDLPGDFNPGISLYSLALGTLSGYLGVTEYSYIRCHNGMSPELSQGFKDMSNEITKVAPAKVPMDRTAEWCHIWKYLFFLMTAIAVILAFVAGISYDSLLNARGKSSNLETNLAAKAQLADEQQGQLWRAQRRYDAIEAAQDATIRRAEHAERIAEMLKDERDIHEAKGLAAEVLSLWSRLCPLEQAFKEWCLPKK